MKRLLEKSSWLLRRRPSCSQRHSRLRSWRLHLTRLRSRPRYNHEARPSQLVKELVTEVGKALAMCFVVVAKAIAMRRHPIWGMEVMKRIVIFFE